MATAAQKTEAGSLAKIAGVSEVNNQIAIDKDADKTLADRAKIGVRRSGEAVTDAWITTKVKWFFVNDELLDGSRIDVDTTKRIVTLTGTVKSADGKTRAISLANHADGVTSVVDRLRRSEVTLRTGIPVPVPLYAPGCFDPMQLALSGPPSPANEKRIPRRLP